VGKYWICKRVAGHAYEAMECIGGSGAMEGHMMPRLYREAPINAIWEGSGNVQALDAINTIVRSKESKKMLLAELNLAKGKNIIYDHYLEKLQPLLTPNSQMEFNARKIVGRIALAMQASILLCADNKLISEAFCLSRLTEQEHFLYGSLPETIDCQTIINRAAIK